MQLVRIGPETGRPIDRFGSSGARLAPLARGGDGVEHPVAPGIAAVWEAVEEHETRTVAGLTAVVVEGDGLDVLAVP